ncbi:hypothetical protein Avbf_08934 [Armadillidium vulgare]|nr:hypothetical protein Avbf_08934 [Armadillidium vulgare]
MDSIVMIPLCLHQALALDTFNPTYTNCDCDGTTNCQKDPNNGNVYIPCEGENLDVTGTAFYCESDRIQLDTCTCVESTLGAKISELRINSGKLATPEKECAPELKFYTILNIAN